ncbi:MAG: hypothetical protein QOH61_1685 [Chloroflexota bacterium]|jgi:2-methylcitrate dehydratase PrpD|nr:hypothetical protein [Chloroflexota bacterium]
MTDGPSITRELAEFAIGLRWAAMPEAVRDHVRNLVLDAIASALAGYDATETHAVAAFGRSFGSSRESSVIGGGHLTPAGATVLNSYLITAITVCDVHRPTTCHVTPQVVAPALVVGEARHASGAQLLAAVAAGLEVTTRVGLGLKPATFRARQWHAPGVIGPFGAAATAGRLLGLSAEQLTNAFGLAGSQAAGTYAHLGTPTMKFQQARAALSGSMAAHLAREDFTASADVLGHPNGGLFGTYSDGGAPDAVLAGIGEDWELSRISLRPWPVAVHLQPVVTGLMTLLEDPGLRAEDVREARVAVSAMAYDMHGEVPFDERFRARLSARYVTAVAIHDRRCGLEQFTAERIADPEIHAFIRDRVRVAADPGLENGTARVELETNEGVVRTEVVLASKGEPANPVSRDELVEKFRAASRARLPREQAAVALERTLDLDALPDVGALLDALRLDPAEAA